MQIDQGEFRGLLTLEPTSICETSTEVDAEGDVITASSPPEVGAGRLVGQLTAATPVAGS